MIFNISQGFKNRLQLLTKRRPKAECNTTAATMGCMYTNHKIPAPDGVMPEDYLMDILNSAEGWEYFRKMFPGAKYNPWNSSVCIAWAVNKALGTEVCKVVEATLQETIFHIWKGGVAVVGGGFIKGGTSGHFVVIVGASIGQDMSGVKAPADIDLSKVAEVFIDDPYGSFSDGYKDHYKGDDIPIPIDKFIKLTYGTAKRKTMQFYSRG